MVRVDRLPAAGVACSASCRPQVAPSTTGCWRRRRGWRRSAPQPRCARRSPARAGDAAPSRAPTRSGTRSCASCSTRACCPASASRSTSAWRRRSRPQRGADPAERLPLACRGPPAGCAEGVGRGRARRGARLCVRRGADALRAGARAVGRRGAAPASWPGTGSTCSTRPRGRPALTGDYERASALCTEGLAAVDAVVDPIRAAAFHESWGSAASGTTNLGSSPTVRRWRCCPRAAAPTARGSSARGACAHARPQLGSGCRRSELALELARAAGSPRSATRGPRWVWRSPSSGTPNRARPTCAPPWRAPSARRHPMSSRARTWRSPRCCASRATSARRSR